MCSFLFIFKEQYSLLCFCVAVIVTSLLLTRFEFSPVLVTVPILFISAIFVLTFSNKVVVATKTSGRKDDDQSFRCDLEIKNPVAKDVSETTTHDQYQHNATQQSDVCIVDEYQVESTDFPLSDGETSDDDLSTTEIFELSNWMCSNGTTAVQNVAISESSDEDEEDDNDDNLIEISLPNSNSVDMNEEYSKQKLHLDVVPDYLSGSIFKQEGLEELLSEINAVNEEENLIEIDLSIGSIKV